MAEPRESEAIDRLADALATRLAGLPETRRELIAECWFCPVCRQGFHDWTRTEEPPNPHADPDDFKVVCEGVAVWSEIYAERA